VAGVFRVASLGEEAEGKAGEFQQTQVLVVLSSPLAGVTVLRARLCASAVVAAELES